MGLHFEEFVAGPRVRLRRARGRRRRDPRLRRALRGPESPAPRRRLRPSDAVRRPGRPRCPGHRRGHRTDGADRAHRRDARRPARDRLAVRRADPAGRPAAPAAAGGGARELPGRDRGVVKFVAELVNQAAALVQSGEIVELIRREPLRARLRAARRRRRRRPPGCSSRPARRARRGRSRRAPPRGRRASRPGAARRAGTDRSPGRRGRRARARSGARSSLRGSVQGRAWRPRDRFAAGMPALAAVRELRRPAIDELAGSWR